MEPSCSLILAGFNDGVVRLLMVQKMEGVDQYGRRVADKSELVLKQVLRPHKTCIAAIAIDSRGELLATGVSHFMRTSGFTHEASTETERNKSIIDADFAPSSAFLCTRPNTVVVLASNYYRHLADFF